MGSIVRKIKELRTFGVVHCGTVSKIVAAPGELASLFGLDSSNAIYSKIDENEALKVIHFILSRDLAYNSEIMPPSQAESLAKEFMKEFASSTPQFYTNGDLHKGDDTSSWDPATEATFDTGILILGQPISGCLWVEDED